MIFAITTTINVLTIRVLKRGLWIK